MSGRDGAGGGTRRILAALRHFLNMLVPSLDDIPEHRPIVAPLLIGWVFSLAAAFSLRPLVMSALEGQGQEVVQGTLLILWVVALITPLVHLLKAGLLTCLGWAVLVLANSQRRVRPILSVLLYGEAILATQGVLQALYLHLATGGSPTSPADLQTSLGLAAFVPATNPGLLAIAQSFSVGHFLWFGFLVIALRRCDGPELRPALGLALFFWGVMVAFSAARAWFTL